MDHDQSNIIVRQASLNQLPLIIAFVASIFLTFWAPLHYPVTLQEIDLGIITFSLPLFGLFPLVIAAALVRSLGNYRLILTPEYIYYAEGIFNWKEKTIRIEYNHIREIEIDQTMFQRIFGMGDLVITVVATSIESSTNMPGIWRPRKIKDLIRSRMHVEEQALAPGALA